MNWEVRYKLKWFLEDIKSLKEFKELKELQELKEVLETLLMNPNAQPSSGTLRAENSKNQNIPRLKEPDLKMAKDHPAILWFWGYCYQNGINIEQNEKKAFKFYDSALDLNYSWAQASLGAWYTNPGTLNQERNRRELSQNLKKAAECYNAAAQQGNVVAICALGICYETGQGIAAKDWNKAIICYKLAATKGYAPAEYRLGACYASGRGVERDLRKALKCYQRAANQGHLSAGKVLKTLQLRVKSLIFSRRSPSNPIFMNSICEKPEFQRYSPLADNPGTVLFDNSVGAINESGSMRIILK